MRHITARLLSQPLDIFGRGLARDTTLLIFRWGNMLLLCIRSNVMPQTVAGALSRTSLEDTGGMRLNNFPDRKEASHGGHSSVVDEGGLVRRVKL
jgi:hypothetical protein